MSHDLTTTAQQLQFQHADDHAGRLRRFAADHGARLQAIREQSARAMEEHTERLRLMKEAAAKKSAEHLATMQSLTERHRVAKQSRKHAANEHLPVGNLLSAIGKGIQALEEREKNHMAPVKVSYDPVTGKAIFQKGNAPPVRVVYDEKGRICGTERC